MSTLSHAPPPYMRQCRRHSVFYNGEKFDSCAVCRASTDAPRLALGGLALALAGLVFIGAGLFLVTGPAIAGLARIGDKALARTESTIRIDPNSVRVELARVESLVYRDEPAGPEEIGQSLDGLADAIGSLRGPPRPILANFKKQVSLLRSRVAPSDAGAYPLANQQIRTEWEVVRQRVFGTSE